MLDKAQQHGNLGIQSVRRTRRAYLFGSCCMVVYCQISGAYALSRLARVANTLEEARRADERRGQSKCRKLLYRTTTMSDWLVVRKRKRNLHDKKEVKRRQPRTT